MMTSSNGNSSALLAICAGNSPVTGEFPAQRPVTRSFDVFFDLRLNKRLSKQSWGWWFETPSHSLWRQCNVEYFSEQYTLIHGGLVAHTSVTIARIGSENGSLPVRPKSLPIVNWTPRNRHMSERWTIFIQKKYIWKCPLQYSDHIATTSMMLRGLIYLNFPWVSNVLKYLLDSRIFLWPLNISIAFHTIRLVYYVQIGHHKMACNTCLDHNILHKDISKWYKKWEVGVYV